MAAGLFSVAALLIMFREALEAAIIIAVLLQIMNRLKMPQLKKWVWIGAVSGVGVAILIGIVFIVLFYVLGNKVFGPQAENIFKGFICWIATLLITMVAFHMLKFYNLERKWKRKLGAAVAAEQARGHLLPADAEAAAVAAAAADPEAASGSGSGNSSPKKGSDLESGSEQQHNDVVEAARAATARTQRWPLLILAFTATLREGIESVLFLTGVSVGDGAKSLIIPGILGIILGALVGVIIFYTGKTIRSLKWFFFVSCGLLLLIGAGLVVNGVSFFTNAYWFGTLYPYDYRLWYNKILWDTSSCCNEATNQGWAILKALFGYTSQPTGLQLFYYCLYWVIIIAIFVYRWYKGILTDRRQAELDDAKSFAQHRAETCTYDGKLAPAASSASKLDLESLQSSTEGESQAQAQAQPAPTKWWQRMLKRDRSAPTAAPAAFIVSTDVGSDAQQRTGSSSESVVQWTAEPSVPAQP